MHFESLTLARACVACARTAVKIAPVWVDELTELTSGGLDEECYGQVLALYQSTFADRKPLSANVEPRDKSAHKPIKPTDKENVRGEGRAHTLY